MSCLKIVKISDLHETIYNYIQDKNIKIVEYENMKECILEMIRNKYIFNMNRDRLRDAMEDLTYMLSPDDDINKDRVEKGLEYEYSDEEDLDTDDDEDDDDDNPLENPDIIQEVTNIARQLLQTQGCEDFTNKTVNINKSTNDDEEGSETVTEEPVTEEPVTEEPVTEEPVTEESVTEEPVQSEYTDK